MEATVGEINNVRTMGDIITEIITNAVNKKRTVRSKEEIAAAKQAKEQAKAEKEAAAVAKAAEEEAEEAEGVVEIAIGNKRRRAGIRTTKRSKGGARKSRKRNSKKRRKTRRRKTRISNKMLK